MALSVNWMVLTVPIVGTLIVTIAVVVLIRAIAAGINRRLGAAYPWFAPAASAVTRRFQSFHVGGMGLPWGFHVSVDERALHLRPTAFASAVGLRATSVPWEAVRFKKKSRSGAWATVSINGVGIEGPGWCLMLAAPDNVG